MILSASNNMSLMPTIRCLEYACFIHYPSSHISPLIIQGGGNPSVKGGDTSLVDYYSFVAMRLPNQIREEIYS